MGQGLTTAGVSIAPDPTVHRIPTRASPQRLLAVDARAACRPQKTHGVPPSPGRASLQTVNYSGRTGSAAKDRERCCRLRAKEGPPKIGGIDGPSDGTLQA